MPATRRQPLEMLTILRDAENFARTYAPRGVEVSRSQMDLVFRIQGRSQKLDLLRLKRLTASYLQARYPHRKFLHARVRGQKLWWHFVGNVPDGLAAGIKIKLTPEELRSILLGPSPGVNTG